MPAPITALPDVLVLGVGGTLGEAWLRGLLSGLESASGLAVRAAALRAAPSTTRSLGGLRRQLETLGARFDGRLRISAVDRANGRRVMFGAPGAPAAEVSEAVLASCAVPWVFAPVR